MLIPDLHNFGNSHMQYLLTLVQVLVQVHVTLRIEGYHSTKNTARTRDEVYMKDLYKYSKDNKCGRCKMIEMQNDGNDKYREKGTVNERGSERVK